MLYGDDGWRCGGVEAPIGHAARVDRVCRRDGRRSASKLADLGGARRNDENGGKGRKSYDGVRARVSVWGQVQRLLRERRLSCQKGSLCCHVTDTATRAYGRRGAQLHKYEKNGSR